MHLTLAARACLLALCFGDESLVRQCGPSGSAFAPDAGGPAGDEDSEDDTLPPSLSEGPIHDVACVSDYPVRSLHSGRRRDGGGHPLHRSRRRRGCQ